jgi:elongation factor P
MTLGYGDLRKGMAIDLDGEPHVVVDYERSKMQQRAPSLRIRFRAIRSGRVVDRTFTGFDVKFTQAEVSRRRSQFIYNDDGMYYFMDMETFEQFPLSQEQLQDAIPYLVDQLEADLVLHEDAPIALEMPITVDMRVSMTDPGHRGDTAQGATKPATLVTGLVVNVPLFVSTDDVIKVDTRSGQYISRV